jgi:hypothetical protein
MRQHYSRVHDGLPRSGAEPDRDKSRLVSAAGNI